MLSELFLLHIAAWTSLGALAGGAAAMYLAWSAPRRALRLLAHSEDAAQLLKDLDLGELGEGAGYGAMDRILASVKGQKGGDAKGQRAALVWLLTLLTERTPLGQVIGIMGEDVGAKWAKLVKKHPERAWQVVQLLLPVMIKLLSTSGAPAHPGAAGPAAPGLLGQLVPVGLELFGGEK